MAFHKLIATASGNPVLAALIEALSSRTVRGRMWRAISDENADSATAREHRAILRALADHDPTAAQIRMSNHLLEVENFLSDRPTDRPRLGDSSDDFGLNATFSGYSVLEGGIHQFYPAQRRE